MRYTTSLVGILLLGACAAQPDAILVAVTREGGVQIVQEIATDGSRREIARIPWRGDAARTYLASGSTGGHLLVNAFVDDPETVWQLDSQHVLVERATGRTLDLMEVVATVDGGLCARAVHGSRFARFRSDERAVLVECRVSEPLEPPSEIGLYQVGIGDGRVDVIADGCARLGTMTHDARAIVRLATDCADDGAPFLIDLRSLARTEISLGERESILYWDSIEPGVVISTTTVAPTTAGGAFAHTNIRWLSDDLARSRPWGPDYTTNYDTAPVANDGALVLDHVRLAEPPSAGRVVDALTIRDRDGGTVEVPFGARPLNRAVAAPVITWAPTSEAFVASGWGTFDVVVHRDGTLLPLTTTLDQIASFAWSPDAAVLLVTQFEDSGELSYTLVDPTTGASEAQLALNALQPVCVTWSRTPWTLRSTF